MLSLHFSLFSFCQSIILSRDWNMIRWFLYISRHLVEAKIWKSKKWILINFEKSSHEVKSLKGGSLFISRHLVNTESKLKKLISYSFRDFLSRENLKLKKLASYSFRILKSWIYFKIYSPISKSFKLSQKIWWVQEFNSHWNSGNMRNAMVTSHSHLLWSSQISNP